MGAYIFSKTIFDRLLNGAPGYPVLSIKTLPDLRQHVTGVLLTSTLLHIAQAPQALGLYAVFPLLGLQLTSVI